MNRRMRHGPLPECPRCEKHLTAWEAEAQPYRNDCDDIPERITVQCSCGATVTVHAEYGRGWPYTTTDLAPPPEIITATDSPDITDIELVRALDCYLNYIADGEDDERTDSFMYSQLHRISETEAAVDGTLPLLKIVRFIRMKLST